MDSIIDYARPTMKAEQALKSLHRSMLGKSYEEAMAHALEAVLESRAAYHAIQHAMVNDK